MKVIWVEWSQGSGYFSFAQPWDFYWSQEELRKASWNVNTTWILKQCIFLHLHVLNTILCWEAYHCKMSQSHLSVLTKLPYFCVGLYNFFVQKICLQHSSRHKVLSSKSQLAWKWVANFSVLEEECFCGSLCSCVIKIHKSLFNLIGISATEGFSSGRKLKVM